MWPIEVIKKINSINETTDLHKRVKEELKNFDYKKHSFKILTNSIIYKSRTYHYLVPNNASGKQILDQMLYDSSRVVFIDELNVYIF
jgi:hypothetical protein